MGETYGTKLSHEFAEQFIDRMQVEVAQMEVMSIIEKCYESDGQAYQIRLRRGNEKVFVLLYTGRFTNGDLRRSRAPNVVVHLPRKWNRENKSLASDLIIWIESNC